MADIFKKLFGGGGRQDQARVIENSDSDFADFAGASDPIPESVPDAATVAGAAATPAVSGVPYTKWYNVHERHSLSEFKIEGLILAAASLIFLFHILGARVNRSKAKAWIRAHASVLRNEFALVGFGNAPTMDLDVNVDGDGLLKEQSLFEFATYASGRQNTAFMDVKLTLKKRFNPIMNSIETLISFFSDMFDSPTDAVEATLYPFDGKENLTVPPVPGAAEIRKETKSTYEGFVWAIVNKDAMRKLREDRYDVSLTSTKDHPKLPNWLSVMSESAEITDALLTAELTAAVAAAGDVFDYLIITDQPTDRPRSLEDTAPRKRLFLKYRLPSDGNYEALVTLFSYFLRLPDFLVQSAQFRPEALKKVRATREAMIAQIKKALEEERNEERASEKEKERKLKREAALKGLDAKAQKKFLEREMEKDRRRSQKRMTQRA
ncbi:hypothetical protein DCS_01138 [Drechmeria coniospora]|uniref:DUF1682 domain protein n=1 Tax=Drechmeria coniospora TaxID=98403 RepID=A0A151GSB1_DRECN|nr:hypothetical protein DCS_01138 [Drechmeria coniospora]KYK60004.1 hypothetical protein DCS_01138 [Drechmeria coniospora]ODA78803.1 hypothetical protein RJ55_06187 [Drechmeria coniospora]